MKNRNKILLACLILISSMGCLTSTPRINGTQPDTMPYGLPDRGVIPILMPMKPPSMTNEWGRTNITTFSRSHGAYIGKQKLVIEANGKIAEYYLDPSFFLIK